MVRLSVYNFKKNFAQLPPAVKIWLSIFITTVVLTFVWISAGLVQTSQRLVTSAATRKSFVSNSREFTVWVWSEEDDFFVSSPIHLFVRKRITSTNIEVFNWTFTLPSASEDMPPITIKKTGTRIRWTPTIIGTYNISVVSSATGDRADFQLTIVPVSDEAGF